MTIFEINNQLINLVASERKITREILNHIVQLYKMDGHKKLGYPSIIDYLRRGLGYSDDAAYRRWKAAKLLLQIPELGEQIAVGKLNLTQSAQVQKAVEALKKEENRSVPIEKQKELLHLIANKNNFDTQKMIAEKLEIKPKFGDFVKPQADQSVRVDMQFTAAQFAKFLKVKSLLSHQVPDQKNADVLEVLFDPYLNKKLGKQNIDKPNADKLKVEEPTLEKPGAEQEELKTITIEAPQSFMVDRSKPDSKVIVGPARTPTPAPTLGSTSKLRSIQKPSRYIPAKIKRQIFIRAKGKCENVDPKSGRECGSSYKLQIDHCKPIALGGGSELSNLRLLCSNCNTMAARNLGLGYETTSYFIKT